MPFLCYCCAREATSEEHVPPKCLFPEARDLPPGQDLRKNLITVPSCDEHNLRKSGDDEHLMYVLALNLPSGDTGRNQFETKVTRAIQRRGSLAARLLRNAKPVALEDASTRGVTTTLAVQGDALRLERTFGQIALGLHRHHFGKNWEGSLKVIPEFLRFLEGPSAKESNSTMVEISVQLDRLFASTEMIGANPSIFRYQALMDSQSGNPVMRLHFYAGSRVFVAFGSDA